MSATVETLLAVARREIDPQDGRVDLKAIANELDDVELRVHSDPMPAAEGDPEIVRRALAPLLDNARRHAHSSVTVTLDSTPGRARVTVRDDGQGLDPDLGEAAFEPGRRGKGQPAAVPASACRWPGGWLAHAVARYPSARAQADASCSSYRPSTTSADPLSPAEDGNQTGTCAYPLIR